MNSKHVDHLFFPFQAGKSGWATVGELKTVVDERFCSLQAVINQSEEKNRDGTKRLQRLLPAAVKWKKASPVWPETKWHVIPATLQYEQIEAENFKFESVDAAFLFRYFLRNLTNAIAQLDTRAPDDATRKMIPIPVVCCPQAMGVFLTCCAHEFADKYCSKTKKVCQELDQAGWWTFAGRVTLQKT